MPSNAYLIMGEAQAIYDRADAGSRELTDTERRQVQDAITRAKSAGEMEDQLRSLSGLGSRATDPNAPWAFGNDPGSTFVQSAGWKSVQDPLRRGEHWTTGLIEVGQIGLSAKGTLLEGVGSPGSGSGGGLLPVPQVVPGVVERLFQPLRFETLLSSAQATGNTLRYITEGTASSGAAGVAEGGAKPESTLGLSTLDEPIKKVATTIVTSDELLEDVATVQSFVSNRLGTFVNIEVERQLFRGTAGGNEVQGILTSRSVPIYAGGTAAGNKAEQLFKAMNGTRGSSFVEPEWIVLHPVDWEQIRLYKDTANQFYGGGPFMGQYGAANLAQASGQVTGATDYLWGKPVYVTTGIGGAGTALIGNSQSATVWARGGLRVEASNSHASLFTTDMVAIRAERRLGLCVYRPQAYCEVRLA